MRPRSVLGSGLGVATLLALAGCGSSAPSADVRAALPALASPTGTVEGWDATAGPPPSSAQVAAPTPGGVLRSAPAATAAATVPDAPGPVATVTASPRRFAPAPAPTQGRQPTRPPVVRPSSGAPASGSPPSAVVSPANPTALATTAPCALLTATQVAGILGAPVFAAGARQQGPIGGQTCAWTTTTTPSRGFGIVVSTPADITASGMTTASFFQQEVAGARAAGGVVGFGGVGDQAYVAATPDSFTSERIFVLQGTTTMTVYSDGGAAAISDNAVKVLTRLAAARL